MGTLTVWEWTPNGMEISRTEDGYVRTEAYELLRSKLIEVAEECAHCGGDGLMLTPGCAMSESDCPYCADLRDLVGWRE